MLSLDEKIIKKILRTTLPSYQAVSSQDNNLGFGFLFYGFTRVLRPEKIVVIGSKAGFSVVNFALGLKDNEGTIIEEVDCYDTKLKVAKKSPMVYFIDPSFSAEKGDANHWYGIGFWDDEKKVEQHWKKFGVENHVRHYQMTSQEFLLSTACPHDVDLLYIDGDHSYEGITHDFNEFHKILKKDAMILAHDVDPELKITDPGTGGFDALNDLDRNKFEVFRLPIFPGLAIVRKI